MQNSSTNTSRDHKEKKWKDKLISKGIPLEFEAARILIANGFLVTADYTYARDDFGQLKDFSVDIHAEIDTPFKKSKEWTGILNLLVECKQRNPNVRWLFLPDINERDLSPIKFGETLRVVDNFTYSSFIPIQSTSEFDKDVSFCYKGVEIDEKTGNVWDSEIRHGISQLKYALPTLLVDKITWSGREVPFLFCPILLTNSKLMILNNDVTTDDVQETSSLNAIAKTVPYLFLYSEAGPDFRRHCIKECKDLSNLNWGEVDKYRMERKEIVCPSDFL